MMVVWWGGVVWCGVVWCGVVVVVVVVVVQHVCQAPRNTGEGSHRRPRTQGISAALLFFNLTC